MTILTTKDIQRRDVRIVVEELRGAILTVTRDSIGGNRQTSINVALTADECRELAASFIKAAGDVVMR